MQIEAYIELLPILVVGLVCGLFKFINDERKLEDEKDESVKDKKQVYKNALKVITSSGVLCAIVYMILSAVELPYLAKVGIASGISFLGLERAVSLAKELLNFKRGHG